MFQKNAHSFLKRNTHGGGDLRTITSSSRKPGDRRRRPRWISRQKFPKRTRILRIPSKPYSVHSVHSAIGSRMNGIIFRSYRKRNSSQKKHEYRLFRVILNSGIVPKDRAHRLLFSCFRIFTKSDKSNKNLPKCLHFCSKAGKS